MFVSKDELMKGVESATPSELPGIIGTLAQVHALALVRLVTPAVPRDGHEDPLLSMPEVARRLGVPLAHARELGRRGELPVVHVGRYVRVRAGALAEWMALRENGRLPRARRT